MAEANYGKRKVQMDNEGLFVQHDGYIARPPQDTDAREGMRVWATHYPGRYIYIRFKPGQSLLYSEMWMIERSVA